MKRYKRGAVTMSHREFVSEHKKLIDTLKNPTKEKLRREANKQSKELKGYE